MISSAIYFFSVLVTGIYFSFEEISIAKECLIIRKENGVDEF